MDAYSICCGCIHDDTFTYDEENKQGVCMHCKDHTTFEPDEYFEDVDNVWDSDFEGWVSRDIKENDG